jgi:hypothetical protein
MSYTKTYEILTKKISLSKVDTVGQVQNSAIIGWEYAPPRVGERYSVYLGRGRVLRTSPVEEIKETPYALMIKTLNSVYRIEYLR